MNNEQRIKEYKESVLMLKQYKKETSPKDDDVKREIQEEIDDLEKWIIKLSTNR